jgi:2-iminobutanoate/2-iminopropanoate deaminase
MPQLGIQTKTRISTTQAPAALGPYSQAVVAGNTLYCSGQVPLDPTTGALVPGGIREQTLRVLENLTAVLQAAGSGMAHVVKTTVYLKNISYFAPEGVVPPARSTVEVARLPKDALIEIDLIASLP